MKVSAMRSDRMVIGCRAPTGCRVDGSVTSIASATRTAASRSARSTPAACRNEPGPRPGRGSPAFRHRLARPRQGRQRLAGLGPLPIGRRDGPSWPGQSVEIACGTESVFGRPDCLGQRIGRQQIRMTRPRSRTLLGLGNRVTGVTQVPIIGDAKFTLRGNSPAKDPTPPYRECPSTRKARMLRPLIIAAIWMSAVSAALLAVFVKTDWWIIGDWWSVAILLAALAALARGSDPDLPRFFGPTRYSDISAFSSN